MNDIDRQYFNLLEEIFEVGEWSDNRTGIRTLFKVGHYLKIDCSEHFPLLTTKRVFWKSAFAEMLGFIRGYTSAADFRKLGCKVWDANANENQEWLNNPSRQGTDDMGLVYGFQWRKGFLDCDAFPIDQLKIVVDKLKNDIDDRRLIVSAWNPSKFDTMCLLPCHYSYQFSLTKNKTTLDLAVNQRSWDLGLGFSYNVSQYAFLLHLIAKITNKRVGNLHFFGNNVHVYENHIEPLKEQLKREPKDVCRPKIVIKNDKIRTLSDLENEEYGVDEYVSIIDYEPHSVIKMQMAI